jgi:menaquinone-9 beta-reductase
VLRDQHSSLLTWFPKIHRESLGLAMHLNLPLSCLPPTCDVLIVGSGPAGSAAARTLAQAGWRVVLVDQHTFPRDKVCGDGLIPDAHNALRQLGVLHEVMLAANRAGHVACIGPSGCRVDVPGRLAVLPRKQLDHIVCRAAVQAGAQMIAPARFVAAIEDAIDGQAAVVGARLQGVGAHSGESREIRAPWVVLATGAVPQALIASNMCDRRTPSGVALRGYVKNETMASRITELEVVWHPKLKPGYGWVFPCGNGVFNIGVGVAHSHAKGGRSAWWAGWAGWGRKNMGEVNLREMLNTFKQVYPTAGELVRGGQWLLDAQGVDTCDEKAALKGAPLRCSLEGAQVSRPGLLVIGEAAGSTYAFTGEGIGKALETGLLAAQLLIEAKAHAWSTALVVSTWPQKLWALRPRYAVYEKANTVNAHPWLVDLLVWSAKRSPRRLQRMSGVLEETHLPSNLLNLKSWMRLLFERG